MATLMRWWPAVAKRIGGGVAAGRGGMVGLPAGGQPGRGRLSPDGGVHPASLPARPWGGFLALAMVSPAIAGRDLAALGLWFRHAPLPAPIPCPVAGRSRWAGRRPRRPRPSSASTAATPPPGRSWTNGSATRSSRPNRLRRAMHRRCPVAGGQSCRCDGAGIHAKDDHARGLCQRIARNCATRNLTSPHDPTLNSASHQCGCVGT
jgi:hypothetical protein